MTYFRSRQWNYIDFLVVLGGYLSLLPGVGNISTLRIIRVLRPLRTLNRIKKLRIIVLTLLGSMKQLANVAVLIMFLFTIYSIIGLQVQPLFHCIHAPFSCAPCSGVSRRACREACYLLGCNFSFLS